VHPQPDNLAPVVNAGGDSVVTVSQQLNLSDAVVMDDGIPYGGPDNLPRFTDPTNVGASLEARARSYLHSNCAGCHRPLGPTPSGMDLRFSTEFADTGTCDVGTTSGTLGIPNARIIAPGDAGSSVLVNRTGRRDVHGMPPLGSNLVDAAGVQLLTDWISSLVTCP
jgi:hypothetical protein